jgi:outer membrane receptor protein involved in Fe transport
MTPGDIAMLLNEAAELRVQPTAPSHGGASVRIQGLRGRYTQILFDGLPLYGGQAGALGALQVPPMDLAQVEVIKGAASALYGSTAVGGMVNLISRRPAPELSSVACSATSAATTYSTRPTRTACSHGRAAAGSVWMRASASRARTGQASNGCSGTVLDRPSLWSGSRSPAASSLSAHLSPGSSTGYPPKVGYPSPRPRAAPRSCSHRFSSSSGSLRLIPPPRVHRHRYHGVLDPNANLRAGITCTGRPEATDRS